MPLPSPAQVLRREPIYQTPNGSVSNPTSRLPTSEVDRGYTALAGS